MDIRAVELVLRKLIEAMERRCAGFPIQYELELLTIETAKERLDKIQAELEAPANMQTHLSQSLENEMSKVNSNPCTGLACGDECDGTSHATTKPAVHNMLRESINLIGTVNRCGGLGSYKHMMLDRAIELLTYADKYCPEIMEGNLAGITTDVWE